MDNKGRGRKGGEGRVTNRKGGLDGEGEEGEVRERRRGDDAR